MLVSDRVGRRRVAMDEVSGPPSPEFFRDLERQRLRALVEVDLDLARSLHADDYQLITPGGATFSREEYLDGIATGDLHYVVFEPASEIAVRVYDRAAAVRYHAKIEILVAGQLDSGLFWHTDIHEVRSGRWQAVWSQATRIRGTASA
jgi:hypothetical protein